MTLGHTGTTESSWNTSAAFLIKLIATSQLKKNFHKAVKVASAENISLNNGSKCLKHNTNLWFPHPIHTPSGTASFKRCFRPDLSREIILVISMQKNLAFKSDISSDRR